MAFAVRYAAFPPVVYTDCQSLLAAARKPLAVLTSSLCPLAGIWSSISFALGG